MNRFHLHLNVADLDASIRFYSQLFGAEPSVTKPDYAKWMLEDPRVNFAISTTGCTPGIDHLGIQVDDPAALEALGQRLHAAGSSVVPEPSATCCYARSDKLWTEDPQGTRWETFHTFGEATTYYAAEATCSDEAACAPAPVAATTVQSACCAPESSCC